MLLVVLPVWHQRIAYSAQRISAEDLPILPTIDAALKSHLQTILADGATKGKRSNVFAKVGDSITYSFEFLHGVGCGVEKLDNYVELATTIDYFRSTTFPEAYATAIEGDQLVTHCPPTSNAFNRVSAAAVVGWGAENALDPVDTTVHPECNADEIALACELRLLQPAVALVMFGTNHIAATLDTTFQEKLYAVVDALIAEGVIPVVSTIPPRLDMPGGEPLTAVVAEANRQIIEVAQARQIPLWNFWLALQATTMVNQGIKADQVHPNTYGWDFNMEGSVDFSAEGLRYGYNQRNLTALQVMDKIKRIVIDDGAPDDGNAAPTVTPTATSQAIYLPDIRRS
ncbi:MAG: SGNH/GDSL hydrolase family protein [Caldilineaceae bacterium]